jgi:hypothetical protein
MGLFFVTIGMQLDPSRSCAACRGSPRLKALLLFKSLLITA